MKKAPEVLKSAEISKKRKNIKNNGNIETGKTMPLSKKSRESS